ncbi:MAG: hypothetical protein OXG37_12895 [Actinomycetia bacterium]|nr:hypothetical protein [Actinomycetes bacterium]
MVRVVCWNAEHKRDSWRFLCDRRGEADVALLQEACTPPEEITRRLDVGPGPWVHEGWNGARAIVRISNRVWVERIPTRDIIASAPSVSAIDSPARLAAGVATLPGGEQLGLVSFESAGYWAERVPAMILQVQRYCEKQGWDAGLPFIVGADLTTWWDSDTTVFGEMMRIGLPLIGPHAATFYSRPSGQKPVDATLQLDYVFASRLIAHRLTVQALNDPGDWGPSDHCRIVINLEESQHL